MNNKEYPSESERLASLQRLHILDTSADEHFDCITRLAHSFFNKPTCILFIDKDRVWIKSKVGLNISEFPRDGFGDGILEAHGHFIIQDATKDDKYANHLLVKEQHIKFFAAHPIRSDEGEILGAFCLLNTEPISFIDEDSHKLQDFAYLTENILKSISLSQERDRVFKMMLDLQNNHKPLPQKKQSASVIEGFLELPLDLFAVFTPDSKFYEVSAGFETELGYSLDTLKTMSFNDIIYPDDRKVTQQSIAKAVRGDNVVQFENRILHSNGTIKWFTWHAAKSKDNDLVYAVIRDVNARKDMETKFLANMSHVVRNPMNIILGMTGLLLLSELTPQQRECIENVSLSAEDLLNIVNDILFYLKIEAGKLNIETIRFNLTEVCENTIQELIKKATSKGLDILLEMDPSIYSELIGDPIILHQILFNLIENAINFTKVGKIVLKVTVKDETEKKITVIFSVKDTGIGIKPDEQQRLFQAFTQSDNLSQGKTIGGSGLGLAISKKLVNSLEGEIHLDSTLGVGSTFFCTLTFEKLPSSPHKTVKTEITNLSDIRILVLDTHMKENSLYDQMKELSLKADIASNEEEALRMLRSESSGKAPYHILIVDTEKPELQGLKFIEEVQDYPTLRLLNFVIVENIAGVIPQEKLKRRDVAASIVKPIDNKRLYAVLEGVLKGSPVVAETHQVEDRPAQNISKLRILIVEDYVVSQKLELMQLQKLGYQADVAENGIEALETLERQEFDIILMDCEMPKMNGYDATREIRKREGANKHTLIIAMTANAMEGDREKCLEAGMDDYIGKPVKLETLALTLAKWTNWSA